MKSVMLSHCSQSIIVLFLSVFFSFFNYLYVFTGKIWKNKNTFFFCREIACKCSYLSSPMHYHDSCILYIITCEPTLRDYQILRMPLSPSIPLFNVPVHVCCSSSLPGRYPKSVFSQLVNQPSRNQRLLHTATASWNMSTSLL